MREPENSYEVSYVISYKRPKIELGIAKNDIFRIVGPGRARELREWSNKEFDGRWLKDHL